MKAFALFAVIIGSVIGYNCYLHVWEHDVAASVVTGIVSSAGFLVWFNRIVKFDP